MFITGSSFCIAQVGVFSRSSSSSLGISAWQFSLSCNYNQKMFIRIIETRKKMIELGNFTEQKNQVLHRRVICFFMYRNDIVPFTFNCRDGAKYKFNGTWFDHYENWITRVKFPENGNLNFLLEGGNVEC